MASHRHSGTWTAAYHSRRREPKSPYMSPLPSHPGRARSVITHESELEDHRVDRAIAVDELLVDAHRVVGEVVGRQHIEQHHVGLGVDLELVEHAPHWLCLLYTSDAA